MRKCGEFPMPRTASNNLSLRSSRVWRGVNGIDQIERGDVAFPHFVGTAHAVGVPERFDFGIRAEVCLAHFRNELVRTLECEIAFPERLRFRRNEPGRNALALSVVQAHVHDRVGKFVGAHILSILSRISSQWVLGRLQENRHDLRCERRESPSRTP